MIRIALVALALVALATIAIAFGSLMASAMRDAYDRRRVRRILEAKRRRRESDRVIRDTALWAARQERHHDEAQINEMRKAAERAWRAAGGAR